MAAAAEETYLPDESGELAEIHSFLEAHVRAHGTRPAARRLLVGAEEGEQVELPDPLYRVLLQVVDALRSGRAVTVAPRSTTLTTQQAADVLGVSRPTVVRLIDTGRLPAERPGSRRQVLLSDVLALRERRRQEQYAMLAETSVEVDDEEDAAVVAARLRAVRSAVAARRRT